MEDFIIIAEFGFTEVEIDFIRNQFSFTLDDEDWGSITLADDEEEEGSNILKLPSGRKVYLPDELFHRETLAAID
ncbi:hypothetical protein NSS79_02490 [Paenibacillus sp. FSL L8-0436]|uniref:hypothetical protein n=1 Tax=Paenibacillus sp. FSL L8-0436 TaxID=2954686 RepID=UPI003158D6C8